MFLLISFVEFRVHSGRCVLNIKNNPIEPSASMQMGSDQGQADWTTSLQASEFSKEAVL